MRVALISDIHGNLTALEAVLAELADEPVDQIVCLGDVAIFGPQPREALARVRELACPVVMGNTDAWALSPTPHPVRDEETRFFNAVELWGAAELTDADRVVIRTFQPVVTLDLAGLSFLGFHGSPTSFNHVIQATTPDEEIERLFASHHAPIMAGGHTHTPLVRRYQNAFLINPGSVGLPWMASPGAKQAHNPAWAEYAILTIEGQRLSVDLRRTPFDLDALRAAVLASGMPHADWWLGDWGIERG